MEYDVGNLLDRIVKLEKLVQQLQVSPRTGIFNSEFAVSLFGPHTLPDLPSVWSEYSVPGPSVTMQTGHRALVLYSARPTAWIGTQKYGAVYCSFRISGATVRAAGVTNFVVDMQTFRAGDFSRSQLTQFELVDGLNPGINTFTCMGMYAVAGGGGTNLNEIYSRSICVIPLDI